MLSELEEGMKVRPKAKEEIYQYLAMYTGLAHVEEVCSYWVEPLVSQRCYILRRNEYWELTVPGYGLVSLYARDVKNMFLPARRIKINTGKIYE